LLLLLLFHHHVLHALQEASTLLRLQRFAVAKLQTAGLGFLCMYGCGCHANETVNPLLRRSWLLCLPSNAAANAAEGCQAQLTTSAVVLTCTSQEATGKAKQTC
jgi:hypothetical protein